MPHKILPPVAGEKRNNDSRRTSGTGCYFFWVRLGTRRIAYNNPNALANASPELLLYNVVRDDDRKIRQRKVSASIKTVKTLRRNAQPCDRLNIRIESLYERRWALSLLENVMSKLRRAIAPATSAFAKAGVERICRIG